MPVDRLPSILLALDCAPPVGLDTPLGAALDDLRWAVGEVGTLRAQLAAAAGQLDVTEGEVHRLTATLIGLTEVE